MKILRLELERVRAFTCAKHGLIESYKFNKIIDITTNLLGIHSARLSTPFVALATRLNEFTPSHLIDELYLHNNLIKIRCMRKTLHIVPLALVPIFHQATKRLRLSDCRSFYRKNNIDEKQIEQLKETIIAILLEYNLSSEQLVRKIQVGKNISSILIRVVIKHLWEEGTLCYVNKSKIWDKEKRVYAISRNRYPHLEFNSLLVEDAQDILVYKHIQSYGPVSEKDIAWWSGMSLTVVRRGIKKFQASITSIYICGFEDLFYIASEDLDCLRNFNYQTENWIKLLAYEDPLLKGYYLRKGRYVCPDDYNKLFNLIGEARASIIRNGIVIGVWELDKKHHRVRIFPFMDISKEDQLLIKQEVDLIEYKLSSINPLKLVEVE